MHTDNLAVARSYFESLESGDIERLRALLADEVSFRGPTGAADGAEECLAGLQVLSGMTTEARVLKMAADGPDVLTWFDLYTDRADPIPVCNWMHIEDGRIARIRVTFDPRPILETA